MLLVVLLSVKCNLAMPTSLLRVALQIPLVFLPSFVLLQSKPTGEPDAANLAIFPSVLLYFSYTPFVSVVKPDAAGFYEIRRGLCEHALLNGA